MTAGELSDSGSATLMTGDGVGVLGGAWSRRKVRLDDEVTLQNQFFAARLLTRLQTIESMDSRVWGHKIYGA